MKEQAFERLSDEDAAAQFAVVADELYTGTLSESPAPGGVIVADGVIGQVGTANAIRAEAVAAGIETVEANGPSTLIPGLVDAHVHLAWGGRSLEGGALSERSMEIAARTALAAGITTVRDCGSPGLAVLRLRDRINEGSIVGPRVFACGPAITTTGGHGQFIGVTADTGIELQRRVTELAAAGVDAIKVMATGGAIDPQTNRRRAQYRAEDLVALVAEAHRLGLPVIAHCNATEGIAHAVAAGVDTIAHCNWLGAEDGTIDYRPALAEEIVRQGISIDLNLEATLAPLAAGDGHAQVWVGHAPANRWELHVELRRRGAIVFLTSDEFGAGVAHFPRLLASAIGAGQIPAPEAIHRASAVPAAVLGIAGSAGTIAIDKNADLVLLEGRLGADPTTLLRVRRVWRAGRPLAP